MMVHRVILKSLLHILRTQRIKYGGETEADYRY